ncbi:hypothetical protein FACS1894211_07910 [Clostridia bacterium]|nr:hypothetical protein FACS1894211_07910 [Clostridia bacterium]
MYNEGDEENFFMKKTIKTTVVIFFVCLGLFVFSACGLSEISQDTGLEDKINALQERVSGLETENGELNDKVTGLQTENKQLKERIEVFRHDGSADSIVYNLNYSTDEDYLIGLTDSVIGACVEVYGSNATAAAAGSGVIIHTDKDRNETYILTNSHVVTAKNGTAGRTQDTVYTKIEVRFFGTATTQRYAASLEARSDSWDDKNDLALLKVAYYGEDHHSVRLYTGALKYAQRVLAIGNGQNLGTSVCDGIISNPSVFFSDSGSLTGELIQITAGVNSGNSGGALFDMNGYLIGINTLKLVGSVARGATGNASTVNVFADNISFSLPVSNLIAFTSDKEFLELLETVS